MSHSRDGDSVGNLFPDFHVRINTGEPVQSVRIDHPAPLDRLAEPDHSDSSQYGNYSIGSEGTIDRVPLVDKGQPRPCPVTRPLQITGISGETVSHHVCMNRMGRCHYVRNVKRTFPCLCTARHFQIEPFKSLKSFQACLKEVFLTGHRRGFQNPVHHLGGDSDCLIFKVCFSKIIFTRFGLVSKRSVRLHPRKEAFSGPVDLCNNCRMYFPE